MKILLIGEVYSENLGDGIICETVASLIKNAYPNSEIIMGDLSGKSGYEQNTVKQKNKKLHHLFKFNRHFPAPLEYPMYLILNQDKAKKKHIKEICNNDYDFAIFAGGQILFNHFVIPISRYVKQLKKKNIPVIFHSCGVGTINGKKLKKKLKKALTRKNISYISIRDDIETVKNVYLPKNHQEIYKTFDTALWSAPEYYIQKQESSIIGLGIMFVPRQEKNLIHFWKQIIHHLNQEKMQWQLFCNGDKADYKLAEQIIAAIKKDEPLHVNNPLAERPTKGKELVQQIAQYKSIISFRLHSHIVAASLGVPSIALDWDKKLTFFFESIHYPERVSTHNDDPKEIIAKLKVTEEQNYSKAPIEEQKQQVLNLLYTSIKSTKKETAYILDNTLL